MATNVSYALLADAVYSSYGEPTGWDRLSIPVPSNDVGFDGAAFRNKLTGEIVVAYRGTDSLLPIQVGGDGDSNADWQILRDKLPDQYEYARQFLEQIRNTYPEASISITGHSLGGSLAQLSAVETGLSAVTFNPYGVGDLIPELVSRYQLNVDPDSGFTNIVNHRTWLDGVSSAPGSVQIGETHTHLAQSEVVAAGAILLSATTGKAGMSVTYMAVRLQWSHSMDRFTGEVFRDPDKTPEWEKDFVIFSRGLGEAILALENAIGTR